MGEVERITRIQLSFKWWNEIYDLITYSCVFLYIVRNRSTDSIFDITNTSSAVTWYCLNDCMGNISDWASTGHYGIHWQPHAGNLMYCADRVLSQYSLNR